MPTFRLTLEYDGRDFQGWQVQPSARTVQQTLEDAVAEVTGQRVRVIGAGRTDAGVHAEGQVASLCVGTKLDAETLGRALNGMLPRDVAVLESAEEEPGFDARHAARRKLYRYRIWNAPVPSPLRADRTLRVARRLDLAAMRCASAHLVGRHDFASFRAARTQVRSTVRTLLRCDVLEPGREPARGDPDALPAHPCDVVLLVEGEGFLRHMVRILAGTLIEVGLQRRPADGLEGTLAARSRAAAGPTAPPHGLTLVRVAY